MQQDNASGRGAQGARADAAIRVGRSGAASSLLSPGARAARGMNREALAWVGRQNSALGKLGQRWGRGGCASAGPRLDAGLLTVSKHMVWFTKKQEAESFDI